MKLQIFSQIYKYTIQKFKGVMGLRFSLVPPSLHIDIATLLVNVLIHFYSGLTWKRDKSNLYFSLKLGRNQIIILKLINHECHSFFQHSKSDFIRNNVQRILSSFDTLQWNNLNQKQTKVFVIYLIRLQKLVKNNIKEMIFRKQNQISKFWTFIQDNPQEVAVF